MRRIILITIAILAMAHGNWERLEDIPIPAQRGACITYSFSEWGGRPYDTVWGVFPNGSPANGKTYFLYYNCGNGHWYFPSDSLISQYYLENTAISFEWIEGVVYVIGNEGTTDILYRYPLSKASWQRECISEFNMGTRPGLTFQPNSNYHRQLYPIPGWLYCIPGGGSQGFWRYAIPSSLEPVAVDGIYPPNGAVIADQTPVFIWRDEPAAINYRLIVSTDPEFATTLIDVITTSPSYQVETKMANGVYYWRTAFQSLNSIWKWGAVHSFTLDGGWVRLVDIPKPVGDGAALAYAGPYGGWPECLFAFVGNGDTMWYVYRIGRNDWWATGVGSPYQNGGSALAVHKLPNREYGPPYAIFGKNSSDALHVYDWARWIWVDTLPEVLGPGASIAAGKAVFSPWPGRYVYLIVGEEAGVGPRNHFWRYLAPVYDDQKEDNHSLGTQGKQGQTIRQAKVRTTSEGVVVEYQLQAPADVRLVVYDALGRQVAVLYSGSQSAGVHRLKWRPAVSGAYFVLLDTGRETTNLKVVAR